MTGRYAVIGNPIGHSKSPGIHMAFAAATGQDIGYERLLAPVDGFAAAVDGFRAAGGLGLNVTAPFKLDAAAYATALRDRAALAGAVNAMAFDGADAIADNFDGVGLVRDIVGNLGCAIRGRRVLLLGAGGAARGALQPLLEQRPAEVVIANRTAAKAVALAAAFAGHGTVAGTGCGAPDRGRPGDRGGDQAGNHLSDYGGGFDVIVNATSTSLHGALPGVGAAAFAPGCLAYDMAYGQGLTPFLRLARDAGARGLADGVGMLVEQAAEAFAWWRGVRPDTRAVIGRMAVPLT